MLGFVVRLASKASRQIGIVAVLVEFPLGVREQLLGFAEGDRRIAADPRPVCIGQQAPGFAQVLRLDRNELGVAVIGRRLDVVFLGPFQVAALEKADRIAELALRPVPGFPGQLRCARVGRILAAFHDLGERGLRELRRLDRGSEVLFRLAGLTADIFDVAPAIQGDFGVLVILHSRFVAARRKQPGVERVGRFLGRVGVTEKGSAQLVLRHRIACSGQEDGEQEKSDKTVFGSHCVIPLVHMLSVEARPSALDRILHIAPAANCAVALLMRQSLCQFDPFYAETSAFGGSRSPAGPIFVTRFTLRQIGRNHRAN